MTLLRDHAWRLALVASGALMVAGGRMHPDADAEDSMRQELATMTSDDRWVTGHALIVLSTVLLALGLMAAARSGTWPRGTRRALRIAALAMWVYVVETVFHLASVVDSDALAHGEAAPVAFTHVALAALLYPVSGLALAHLAARTWAVTRLPHRLVAAVGVVGGLVHALSVPFTILLPDTESTPLFAGAALCIAAWSIGTGLLVPRAARQQPGVAAPAVRVPQP